MKRYLVQTGWVIVECQFDSHKPIKYPKIEGEISCEDGCKSVIKWACNFRQSDAFCPIVFEIPAKDIDLDLGDKRIELESELVEDISEYKKADLNSFNRIILN